MAGARFLDLYAGTGAVGLEAISQGAASAAFVENDPLCARIIHENIQSFKYDDKATFFRLSALGDLSVLPGPFDLIFMGPPYRDAEKNALALVHPTLENIHKYDLLAKSGLIIAQHHKKEPVAAVPEWALKRQERYGDTILSFFVKPT
jgi:16S rRNA (guanine(966)-N(2))-methyltransferase RsmD